MKRADKAGDMKHRVTDFGRKTVDKLDDSRETAAGAVDATGSTLHTRGDQISGAARLSHQQNTRHRQLRSSDNVRG